MSNQNRFLLPHQPSATSAGPSSGQISPDSAAAIAIALGQDNEFQVDTDFDSYWEEEARNPHRNRIRIGRQYQATVPPLLKAGERDLRKLEDLETLSFCPKRAAKVTNGELDNYFAVAKSLNLFASLVETRSLLGRDVTIADLNRIKQREGLSLASVIQPPSRQQPQSSTSPQSSQLNNPAASSSPQKSPSSQADNNATTSTTSPSEPTPASTQEAPLNKPLMKALSHFISLHHPCYHNDECKKLEIDIPPDDDSVPAVNLRTSSVSSGSPSKDSKSSRLRSRQQATKVEETDVKDNAPTSEQDQPQVSSDNGNNVQSQAAQSYDDWSREEVELFSKAIEVCGKKFSSIKKEFLPSKSVMSIVEYYYVGSRDTPESKKKISQALDTTDGCSSPEKTQTNNNGQGGNGSNGGDGSVSPNKTTSASSTVSTDQPSRSKTNSSSNSNNEVSSNNRTNISDACDMVEKASALTSSSLVGKSNSRNSKTNSTPTNHNNKSSPSSNIDARMSVYNFDDEFKEDSINITPKLRFEAPKLGPEVKPLKAKPILPNASSEGDATNSNVGSLKFFMDGQLVLKLNACQEQQQGSDKCHWVQSGDKLPAPSRQKRYSKRSSSSDQQRPSSDLSQNGSQSNSALSSQHDEDSTKTNEDLTDGEDSKGSAHSFTPRPKSFSASPTPKRLRQGAKSETGSNCVSPIQGQPTPPIDYNRLAVNNRMKENATTIGALSPQAQTPLVNQAQAAMPWLDANSFAMAAALLRGLPFPGGPAGLLPTHLQNNLNVPTSNLTNSSNNNNLVNLASSKPMDLSVEPQAPKPIQTTAKSRSRSKQKNS